MNRRSFFARAFAALVVSIRTPKRIPMEAKAIDKRWEAYRNALELGFMDPEAVRAKENAPISIGHAIAGRKDV